MKYFTADLHLGSEEILRRENRPFLFIRQFQEYIIDLWNNQFLCNLAHKNDLYVLGDFVNYNSNYKLSLEEIANVFNITKNIRANVHLIVGNGEERIISDYFDGNIDLFREFCIKYGFASVDKEAYLEFYDKWFYLNHYPRNHKEGYINLFGHTHRATGLWKPYGLNVGCDLNHFKLFSEQDIADMIVTKETWWDDDIDNRSM